jgi:chromate transport protein ChrA
MYFCFFDAELVASLLTRTELIDAIVVGQFTPGPSVTSLWAIKSMESQGIHFYAGDIPPCICCPIESYGKKK